MPFGNNIGTEIDMFVIELNTGLEGKFSYCVIYTKLRGAAHTIEGRAAT